MFCDRPAAVLALWETTATTVEAGVVEDGIEDEDWDRIWGEGGDGEGATLSEAVDDAVPELLELLELNKVSPAECQSTRGGACNIPGDVVFG